MLELFRQEDWRMTVRGSLLFSCLLVFFGLLAPGQAAAQSAPLSDLDALRYIATYPDLIEAYGADPAKGRSHYETWGLREGRKITLMRTGQPRTTSKPASRTTPAACRC